MSICAAWVGKHAYVSVPRVCCRMPKAGKRYCVIHQDELDRCGKKALKKWAQVKEEAQSWAHMDRGA